MVAFALDKYRIDDAMLRFFMPEIAAKNVTILSERGHSGG